jgi:hypothetical protein
MDFPEKTGGNTIGEKTQEKGEKEETISVIHQQHKFIKK